MLFSVSRSRLRSSRNSTDFSKANCPAVVDPLVYQIALIMGVIFAMFYAINGFVINFFGKKNLTSESKP